MQHPGMRKKRNMRKKVWMGGGPFFASFACFACATGEVR